MGDLPSGTVTFLFTDIEGSTRLWEERRGEMADALAEHDAIVRSAIEANNGYVFATGGDGFAAVFGSAGEAVAAAEHVQGTLDGDGFIRVRMGIHTGEVQERDGDYFGPAVNQAARIMDAGHGGQVLLSEVSAALVEIDCLDLGEHTLSGISGPVGIRQLGSGEFPALRGGTVGGAINLPVYRTSLIGREELLTSIRSAFGSASLVTLTGVGGVGKTRLAVEVADRAAQDFPDGVWFVGLAQLGDGSALPRTVLSEVGMEGAVGEPVEVLGSVIGSNRMLLVLDNCEHVIAEAGDLVDDLLDRCEALAVLATSREGLAISGEHLVAVPPLSGKVGEGEANSERVRMLIERALAANPAMATTVEDDEALRTIADELDGVPLAMELAAARLAALTPVQVAERLGDRFRLLTGGRRSRERHQTLRTAVAWSYELLDEQSQRLFDELSVFSDGFTLELALLLAADLDEVDVIEMLEDLVQKSMIVFDPTEGPGRYRTLMTLRQFGQENLDDAGIADDVRSRWANALDQYTAHLVAGLHGESELVNRYALQAEMSNMSSVCEWSLAGGESEPAARMLSTCWLEIAQAAANRLGELATQLVPLVPEASAAYPGLLGLAGFLFSTTGDLEGAESWFARADRLNGDLSSSDLVALTTSGMATLAAAAKHAEAAEIGLSVAEQARARGDVEAEALILAMLPFYLTSTNRHDESVAIGRRAVASLEALDHTAWKALAATGLGYSLAWQDSREAIPMLEEAIPVLRMHGFAFMEATAERALARVVTTTGEHAEAARLLLHALEETVASGSTLYQNSVLFYTAPLLAREGRWEEAAIASGSAQYRLVFLIAPSYANLHRELTDAIEANLGEQTAGELRATGAAMTEEELIEWARVTLQSLAEA